MAAVRVAARRAAKPTRKTRGAEELGRVSAAARAASIGNPTTWRHLWPR
ncbi:MAG: hypothetical protein QW587_04845 [Candidatus Bathyarchaeia archaeon]